MTTKKLLSVVGAASFAALCFTTTKVAAQSPPPVANNDKGDSLQMVIDYGQVNQKRRQSHHGIMEPVGLVIAQPVTITLEFTPQRAGDSVLVSALDGGQVDPSGPFFFEPVFLQPKARLSRCPTIHSL
jgi:hypothetical protein